MFVKVFSWNFCGISPTSFYWIIKEKIQILCLFILPGFYSILKNVLNSGWNIMDKSWKVWRICVTNSWPSSILLSGVAFTYNLKTGVVIEKNPCSHFVIHTSKLHILFLRSINYSKCRQFGVIKMIGKTEK